MTSFSPPGPGSWALDRSHYPGGTTRTSKQLLVEGMSGGMRKVMAELGMPADTLKAAFVNGFMYTRLVPLISPDKPSKSLPPKAILKIATRLHPEFRRRNKTATAILANPPAPAILERWRVELKPKTLETNRRFQFVDLASLSDVGLSEHWESLIKHATQMMVLHFWLHGFDLGPIAQFVATAQDFGIPPKESLTALTGASPSTTEPKRLLHELRMVVAANGNVPRSLEDVRHHSPEAARLLDAYLADRQNLMVTRYDLDGLTLGEMPEVVLTTIMSAEPEVIHDDHKVIAPLRERVAADCRERFDAELAMARSVMDMRDDNGPITVEWVAGLLRKSLLEVGRRLVSDGRATEVDHAFELEPAEVGPLLTSAIGPLPDQLAKRAAERHAEALLSPPLTLGPDEQVPPLDVLPVALRTMVRAVNVAIEHMGMSGAADADPLSGSGVGTTSYRGRVRRADSPETAIDLMEPGDVLVVRATSPAFNAVLAIAGAVVTADGGALSHAAVLARELGIPAVVGARGALGLVDGSMVEVDPVAGVVRVI